MANYKSQPVTFKPYVSQIPMDAFMRVGAHKEEEFRLGVEKVQSTINQLATLDIARSEGKQYLDGRMSELMQRVNSAAGSDFSNPDVFNQLINMAGVIGGDQNIINEVSGTMQIRAKQKEISDLKEKHPELYSADNEAYAMMDINNWLGSGAPVGTKLNDRRQFSPYYDYNKEKSELVKDFMSRPDEFVTESADPNTGLVIRQTFKGKTPDQLRVFLQANLSDKAKGQVSIEGTVRGSRIDDNTFLDEYIKDKDSDIAVAKENWKSMMKEYLNPNTPSDRKKEIEFNIKSNNDHINSLDAEKRDKDAMKNALKNKADYFGQLYTKQYINTVAATSSQSINKLEYDTNDAYVSQLNRIQQNQLEQFRQDNENMRHSQNMEMQGKRLAFDYTKLDQDTLLKEIELGLRNADGSPKQANTANANSAASNYAQTILPITPNQTTTEAGADGYNRYMKETTGLINTYDNSKNELFNSLSSDAGWQNTVSKLSGKSFSAMSQTEKNTAFNTYLESKEEQWRKGNAVGDDLDKFFSINKVTKEKLDARRSFGNSANDWAMKQLEAEGFKPYVMADGTVITLKDMLEYATTGKNNKILNASNSKGNVGSKSVELQRTGANSDIASTIKSPMNTQFGDYTAASKQQEYQTLLKKLKNSKIVTEYKNRFNQANGVEHNMISFNYSNKGKDKVAAQEFNSRASVISGVFSQMNSGKLIPAENINPNFVVDYTTGDVNFSYQEKNDKGKEKTIQGKVNVPSWKNSMQDVDKEYTQNIFYNNGSTTPMLVRGTIPIFVSIKSSSTDAGSLYTVNPDKSAAKYTVRDKDGNLIKDPFGGFNSPSSAYQWITELNNSIASQEAKKWFVNQKKDPNFAKMSEQEKANKLEQFLQTIDPTSTIQTLSGNSYINMLRDFESSIPLQAKKK